MELTISYSQLIVMNHEEEQPYVEWTDEDFERGYAETDGTIILKRSLIIRVKLLQLLGSM